MITVAKEEKRKRGSITEFIRVNKKITLLIIGVVVTTLFLSAALSLLLEKRQAINLPSIGNIHTIGVNAYWDQSLHNQTERIQWGAVYLGQTYNVTLYLQSTSNVPAVLDLTVTNWTYIDTNGTIVEGPANSTPYMNLTWNYNYQILNPNETIETTIVLTTDNSLNFIKFLTDNRIEQFTVDMTIQADEK